MAAFGWSVGDIVASIQLVAKVTVALKEVGGASEEYIQTMQDLQALELVLHHLQHLETTGSDIAKINAICATSESSRRALRELLNDFAKFERHLGKATPSVWHRGAHRKAQWALFASKELKKLQNALGMQFKTLMFLLQCQQLSSANSTHEALQQNALRQDIVAQDWKNRYSQMSQSLFASERKIGQKLDAISDIIRDSTKAEHDTSLLARNEARLQSEVMTSMLVDIQSAIGNIGLNGSQTHSGSNKHEKSIELVHKESNPHSYQAAIQGLSENAYQLLLLLCLSIRASFQRALCLYPAMMIILKLGYTSIVRNPTRLLSSSIHFTDALGRSIYLDHSIFKSWPMFNQFLLDRFEDHPGEHHIRRGKFILFHRDRPDRFISENEWSNEVMSGAHISMSIGLTIIRFSGNKCPRKSCGASAVPGLKSHTMECISCSLKFAPRAVGKERLPCGTPMCTGFVDVFDRVALNACRICGSRPALEECPEDTVLHNDDAGQFLSSEGDSTHSLSTSDDIVSDETWDQDTNESSSIRLRPTTNSLGDNPLGVNGSSMTKGAQIAIINAKQKRLDHLRASMEAMEKSSKAISFEQDSALEHHEIESLQWVHLVHNDEPEPTLPPLVQEQGLTNTTAAQSLLQARLQLLKKVHSFSKATTQKHETDGTWAVDSVSGFDVKLGTGSVLEIQEDDATINWRKDSPAHSQLGKLFVVIQDLEKYYVCLRVSTYKGLATTESYIDSSKHALIYFEGSKPVCFPEERALMPSITITSDHLFQSLDPLSRLSFERVYNISRSAAVKRRGTVQGAARSLLKQSFKCCFKKNYELCFAAKGGSRAEVLKLLAHGADPNAVVGVYGNALFEAVKAGHPDVAELLLEYGAIPYLGLTDRMSSSPLFEALVRDHRRLVKAIVERSICSDCYQQPNQRHLIRRAAIALAACEQPRKPFDRIHGVFDSYTFNKAVSGFCHQMWPLLVYLPIIDIDLHRAKAFEALKIERLPMRPDQDELEPMRRLYRSSAFGDDSWDTQFFIQFAMKNKTPLYGSTYFDEQPSLFE